jgi:hypothetical protein
VCICGVTGFLREVIGLLLCEHHPVRPLIGGNPPPPRYPARAHHAIRVRDPTMETRRHRSASVCVWCGAWNDASSQSRNDAWRRSGRQLESPRAVSARSRQSSKLDIEYRDQCNYTDVNPFILTLYHSNHISTISLKYHQFQSHFS